MLTIMGSTLAFIASILASSASKKFWIILVKKIILEMKYNLMGAKECFLDLLRANSNKTDLPCKTGSIAIVTGGSRGIGVSVVKMLLECDMTVIIGCRRVEAGEKAIKQIRESGTIKGKTKVYQLDNASLTSVKKFAENIKRDYEKINILINNAGIMFGPYVETSDGFEHQWGVNYLSHFLLTALLMPQLCNAGKNNYYSRVVNVSSCAHVLGQINFNDINSRESFITGAAYAQSKLAQVISTKSLQQLCEKKNLPVRFYAVHPGVVNTDLFEHSFLYKFRWFMSIFFKTPEQGATTTVFASISDKVDNLAGEYLSNCMKYPVNPLTNDQVHQQKLLNLSLEQVKLNDFLQYL